MDTKTLRQKILDLAIRGKLVPQDPNDEPASVLLERIRAQKQQMVREGKLKSKDIKDDTVIFVGEDNLHYEKFADGSVKCIEDKIPFNLPENWAWVRLQSFCTMSNGTAKRNGADGTHTTVLRLADLGEDDIFYSGTRSVILTDEEIAKYSLSDGDILFIRVNGSKENVGKSYFFEGQPFPVAYCDHLIRCTPSTVLRGKLLSMFMRCGYVRQLIGERMVSAAGQNTISQPSLGTILLPIPPHHEQDRILQKLTLAEGFIEQLCEAKHELVKITERAKAKILDLAIHGQLVPQDPADEPASVLLDRIRKEKENLIKQGKIKRDKKETIIFRGDDNSYYEKIGTEVRCINGEIPFDIPNSWTFVRLKHIGEIVGGGTPKTNVNEYWDGDIPWLTPADLSGYEDMYISVGARTITEAGLASSSAQLLPANSVLYSSRAPIGYVAISANQLSTNQGFKSVVPFDINMSWYLYYCLIARTEDIVQRASGTTFKEISGSEMAETIIPLPPAAEQKRIAATIQVMLHKFLEIEKSLS